MFATSANQSTSHVSVALSSYRRQMKTKTNQRPVSTHSVLQNMGEIVLEKHDISDVFSCVFLGIDFGYIFDGFGIDFAYILGAF